MALLSFDFTSHPSRSSTAIDHDAQSEHRKPLSAYGLLCLVFVFILGPQPSILLLSTSYYILIRKSWTWAVVNLGINYLLLFMMLSSLMVTLVRDPGPVKPLEQLEGEGADNERDGDQNDEDISLAEALLSRQEGGRTESFSLTPVKSNGESRWCRKCWAPKPERTHHCSECNRCVLKMDHHCPWLANRCVGARVYPSFLHFLLTTTIYSAFVFYLAFPPIQYYLGRPLILDDQDMTPYHAMTVALLGAFFSISVGSFFIYHMYLMLTNQTTLESLAPMLLLQYLPDLPPETDDHHNTTSTSFMAHDEPPPFSSQPPSPRSSTSSFRHNSPPPYVPPPPARGGPTGSGIRPGPGPGRSQTFAEPFRFPSPPPPQPRRLQEHELNKRQRQLIREAHARIRVYDLGWRENLLDVLGGPDVPSGKPRPSWVRVWAERVFWGGRGRGDGHSFRHNPRAEGQLRALAADLAAAATR